MYDLLMRLPFLGWILFWTTIQLAGLGRFMNTRDSTSMDLVYAIHFAMRISSIVFLLLIVVAVILRTRPAAKASGLEPRISALIGTFLLYGMVFFPRRDLPLSAEITATVLTLVGCVGAIVALSQLGRSFSVMAETRRLVTWGPYRYVRHPLYIAEEIAAIGLFIQFASFPTACLLVVQIAFQLRRMHNEELVLAASFPEYAAYSRTTDTVG